MVTTVLGKVAVTPKGEWNSTIAYEKLDVVSYNGSSYLSVRTVPAATPLSNTNYWLLLAQKGDTGNGVASIEKTGTSGLTDTYTITYTDGSTSTFTVINGEAATVVLGTVSTGAEGTAVVITNSGDEHNAVLNFTIPRGNTGNGIQGIELTGTSGGVKTYTITFTDGNTFSFDVTDGEVTEERLAEALADYAFINGYYEEMTVGDAEQLVATQYVSDSEPYLFRTTGGSADVGNREYKKSIVGGTVAWNQLARALSASYWEKNNGTAVYTDGVATITATGVKLFGLYLGAAYRLTVNGHKYFTSAYMTQSRGGRVMTGFNSIDTVTAGTKTLCQHVIASTADNQALVAYKVDDSTTEVGDTLTIEKYICIDLTQMFGSTIADYIYSLEQANAGAGVAWFKKLFPKDYYEYDAGSLKHVEGLSEHVTVGFNQWDEEWEGGSLDTATGIPSTVGSQTRIRSKNFIPVIAGQTYYFTNLHGGISDGLVTVFYDADKNYIEGAWRTGSYLPFIVPSGARYMKFNTGDAYGGTYRGDICINLSWSGYRNGEYEPYEKHSYPLDDSLVLRGIPKLDSSNNLYYDGDVYNADGTVERKYGIVELTSALAWGADGGTNAKVPAVTINGALSNTYLPVISNGGVHANSYSAIRTTKNGIAMHLGRVLLNPDGISYADNPTAIAAVQDYLDALNNKGVRVYVVYELATPTTEQAEPYNEVQICDDFGTEEFVSTSIVPVGHVTDYPANLRDKLQHLPDLSDSDGVYAILQSNKQMSLTTIPTAVAELPEAPTEDGSYVLKATVSNGAVTYAWEAE